MTEERSKADSETGEKDGFMPRKLPAGLKEFRGFYLKSIEAPEEFWRTQASRIKWDRTFTGVVREDISEGHVEWFMDGVLNAFRNAIDAPIDNGAGDIPAVAYFDASGGYRSLTYKELRDASESFAAALAASGMIAGDRFMFYLPDSPETIIGMLACARLGIVTVPVPIRYTAELVREIAANCAASGILLASDDGSQSYTARAVAVVDAFKEKTAVDAGRESVPGTMRLSDFLARGTGSIGSPGFDSEHPLFILYANSAAGVPRGSVFATGGYLVQAAVSYDYIFRSPVSGEGATCIVCALDLASAAGQCYGLWGPLANGATVVIAAQGLEPHADRFRRVLDICDAPALLTTPTLLAELKTELGDAPLSADRSFRFVASSGDVLRPRHISFSARSLTSSQERVLNLWVQTECGSAIVSTWPGAELNRSGALGLPFPGIRPLVVNYLGQPCRPNESGQLVFSSSWPSMIRTIWGQDERYRQLYFQRVPGYYSTNDGARGDGDGFYWFMGRLDDVIKIRGQSMATSEVEAVLIAHPFVAEAAVVSAEAEDGESLVAFVVLEKNAEISGGIFDFETLEEELADSIERRVGEHTLISHYIIAPELPRTRTGKIVRRVLKRIAVGDISGDEDLSHLANPGAVDELIKKRGL